MLLAGAMAHSICRMFAVPCRPLRRSYTGDPLLQLHWQTSAMRMVAVGTPLFHCSHRC